MLTRIYIYTFRYINSLLTLTLVVQLLEKMGRQPAPDGKNLVHPLLVVPSSAESTLETTEKRTTMTGASVGALCATALGAAAIWKLKSAL